MITEALKIYNGILDKLNNLYTTLSEDATTHAPLILQCLTMEANIQSIVLKLKEQDSAQNFKYSAEGKSYAEAESLSQHNA